MRRIRTSGRRSGVGATLSRGLSVMALAAALFLVPAGAAVADEEESTQASMLVEQAIALIANDAGDERIAERIGDALEAPDKQGVDLSKVSQASELIEAQGEDPAVTARARTLLLDSLGGRLPSAPLDGPATGVETGTSVVLDEFAPAKGVSDAGDAVLLAVALTALVTGLYLARRLRPRHTLRQLTHPTGSEGAPR